jgi:hypothetical protein
MNDWIEVNLPLGPIFTATGQAPSMKKNGLLRPGVLIEFFGGKQVLVGDINELSGVCDHCAEPGHSLVSRYKVVWEPPPPPAVPVRKASRI